MGVIANTHRHPHQQATSAWPIPSRTRYWQSLTSTPTDHHYHACPQGIPTEVRYCVPPIPRKKTLHSKTQLPFFAGSEAEEAETVHWLLPSETRSHKRHKPVMRSKITQKLKKESSSIHCRVWEGGFLKTTEEKDREQTHSSPDQKGKRKEGAESNPGSLLIMSQMSRFRAQSGPSSKSFVALSTKLAAVMLLRYCWYTKICTQKKAPPKKNSPQIPPLRFHSLLLLTISRALTKSPQTPTPTLADALSLSHTHTHSLSLSLFLLSRDSPTTGWRRSELPTSRWYRHFGKRQGTFVRELSEEEQRGNEGERDCPDAWTAHAVQDKSTTYTLITYFPSRGTNWGVGNFCALSVPLKIWLKHLLNPDSLTHELKEKSFMGFSKLNS